MRPPQQCRTLSQLSIFGRAHPAINVALAAPSHRKLVRCTSSVTVDPAAINLRNRSVSSATSVLLEPIKTFSPNTLYDVFSAIVITGDGAGANVCFRTNIRITDVSEMIGFRPFTDVSVL